NPLEDKDTGEELTMLIIDLNFITTKIVIYLEDFDTGESIEGEEIEIMINGDDASNLISFSGEKPDKFTTSTGYLELGYDPNFQITKETPLELSFIAVGENYFSLPEIYSFTTEGTKNIVLRLINIGVQPKSGGGFDEPFQINVDGGREKIKFMRSIPGYYGEYSKYNLYRIEPGQSGTLSCSNIIDNVIYPEYGVFWYSVLDYLRGNTEGRNDYTGLPTQSYSAEAWDIIFTVAENSQKTKCADGLTIKILGQYGITGSGTFDYKIEFGDGNIMEGRITATDFPHSELIGPIYYNNPITYVSLIGDAQYIMRNATYDLLPVYRANPCGEEVIFTAEPRSNLTTYKINTQYKCSSNPSIAVALSISGQFRKVGVTDWTGFSFTQGICEIQLEKDEEYEFRLNIDGEWKTYTLPTDPDDFQDFLNNNQNSDYTVESIGDEVKADGSIEISVIVLLDQSICDMIG
ncbi:hypothetical protein ACFLSI_06230, partial [Bacteroidota bacterium]